MAINLNLTHNLGIQYLIKIQEEYNIIYTKQYMKDAQRTGLLKYNFNFNIVPYLLKLYNTIFCLYNAG